jgi:predicted transposase/invertase (TIGR01784 family)
MKEVVAWIRTLFYWSRLYSSQIKKGQNYKNLNKTITINILNFNYIDSIKYHTTYHLWEDEEKIRLTDILEIHFVELPKFLDENPELNNSLNKWLAFLTKPQKEVIEMGEPAIRKAITVLDTLSRDPEMVRLAELRMKKLLDEKSMIEGAREEGKIEGKVEGKIEGMREIAKNALRKGAEISFVAEITGLNEDEVIKLKDEINNH